MTNIEFLELDDVLHIIRLLGVGPVRDIGLLDSSVNRPRASAFGLDAYPSLELKAAALFHSLVKNHSLVDGNKRTAWLCTMVFCDLNGWNSRLTNQQAYDLVLEVAGSHMEVNEIASRLQLEAD